MFKHNFFVYSGGMIARSLGEMLYFPFWWYGAGAFQTARALFKFWLNQEKLLGVGIWVRNIFVPMYGQRDIAGRVISFIMRLFQIIIRGLALLFWLIFIIIAFLLWLALPIALILAIGVQLSLF